MALKPNTIKVIEFLQAHPYEEFTAQEVGEALGLDKKIVDGAFTRGLQTKGLGVRREDEIECDDGSHKKVKYLRLTKEGMEYVIPAEDKAKAASAE